MSKEHLVDKWHAKLARDPELAKYVAPGVARSYPMLGMRDGSKVLLYFYHVADQTGPNTIAIFPPHSVIALDYNALSLVEEVSDNPFDIPPFEETSYSLPAEEKAKNRERAARLRELYDLVAPRYPDEPAGNEGAELLETLKALVPYMLWPYYEAMAPDFIKWLGGGR